MRGNTATISVTAFRTDWLTHMPISALCQRWTISKDQVIRLAVIWDLPRRHDRRSRFKPKRQCDPTPQEIQQACLKIQATWTDEMRADRSVYKPQPFKLMRIELTQEARQALDAMPADDVP